MLSELEWWGVALALANFVFAGASLYQQDYLGAVMGAGLGLLLFIAALAR